MHPDSTEIIARDIARDQGREAYWHFYHPVVRWTIYWLENRGYLWVVDEKPLTESRAGIDIALNQWDRLDGLEPE